ncbi:uncharacterized protein LOC124110765 [Haliotis rufescens]|uniref:uncharacterized protein LOC124110765 n=1 Tax=Haliotis rufescens TaxID=6454 RepID=UPI00201EE550|nr:uncharacterized protein LOC124110765 [Haliotis rufescens]XP_046326112.2 uncharacterized protein LOC124110765 [Haliotis rufescens]
MSEVKKRVLIIGAGAAGTAAAYSLGRYPDRFDVEVWEKSRVPGGVATTNLVKGNLFVNDGVQGGTPTYRNTLNLMNRFGFETTPVHMKISFGKGQTAWTNYTETELTEYLKEDIKKFGSVLKTVNRYEAFYIFIPISRVLKWYGFSDLFCNEMVYPLTALFFGTGNQTPNVSAAIVARVFLDDDLRLFDYDSEHLLSQTPEMFAFPNLESMYKTIIAKSGIIYHANRPVTSVRRTRKHVYVTDSNNHEQVFDDIIFACDAETALKVLDEPTLFETRALGNVKYYNDLIVTHEDREYMDKFYELHVDTDQYFVRTDDNDSSKLEMSFNLTNYQPQLKSSGRNIFQTIFLDDQVQGAWTRDEIKEDKILLKRWWRQFSHSWKHFAFTVPFMRYLQGKKHTWYCGSYTLINTHEVAVISGLAAAHQLGAPYPFTEDSLAAKQFDHYMMVIHGQPRSVGVNKDTVKSYLLAPLMFLFACFALLLKVILRVMS